MDGRIINQSIYVETQLCHKTSNRGNGCYTKTWEYRADAGPDFTGYAMSTVEFQIHFYSTKWRPAETQNDLTSCCSIFVKMLMLMRSVLAAVITSRSVFIFIKVY